MSRGWSKAVIALSVPVACGGLVGDGDGSGDASSADGNVPSADAGWTACASPSGILVCGGPSDCNMVQCSQSCLNGDELEPCGEDAFVAHDFGCVGVPCPDDTLCLITDGVSVTDPLLSGQCVVNDIGELFHINGEDSRMRYMDMSAYDGTPLPAPTNCPDVAGLTLCGGACGDTCPHDTTHVCFGRSPAHVYSLCVVNGGGCSATDQSQCKTYGINYGIPQGCLIFQDDSASQPVADVHGLCVDQATCDAAQQGYPGGAKCIHP